MFAVVGLPIVVIFITCGRVGRGIEVHMTLAATGGEGVIAFDVPAAVSPVVVLILKLHPPNLIDLLIDELFVAGTAVFRCLV